VTDTRALIGVNIRVPMSPLFRAIAAGDAVRRNSAEGPGGTKGPRRSRWRATSEKGAIGEAPDGNAKL